jgi:hypothetical protein
MHQKACFYVRAVSYSARKTGINESQMPYGRSIRPNFNQKWPFHVSNFNWSFLSLQ